MQELKEKYELVIGLEVHAQLLTESKLFCGDPALFGSDPNTNISAISLAHPGTLPRLNKKAVDYAVMMGLACGSAITRENFFARKNYFYPDLPKGYQISQHTAPVCVGGFVSIETSSGPVAIPLNRIHLEEDAGKSLHDVDPESTALDYNRAGVPLIEIVTEPAIRSSAAAAAYLTELRKRLRYLGVCDGNMEEGSLRCDANISVRLKGDTKLGTKVEIKNLNSIRNVKRAIDLEEERLISLLESGQQIVQETRSYDANNHHSFSLRNKEEANDYRYFPDPDLSPFTLTDEDIAGLLTRIPALPQERARTYTENYGLSSYDAAILIEERSFAEYFESVCAINTNYKAASNWMIGPVKAWLNDNNLSISEFPLSPGQLAELISLTDSGSLNFSTASTKIFPALIADPQSSAEKLARGMNLIQDSDHLRIEAWADEALARFPEKIAEYRKGKKGLIGLFVGEVKKLSGGKADPKLTNAIIEKKLQSSET